MYFKLLTAPFGNNYSEFSGDLSGSIFAEDSKKLNRGMYYDRVLSQTLDTYYYQQRTCDN